MQIRQNIVDIFSTFLQFNSDWDGIWVSDRQLRRSILNSLNQSTSEDISERFWALYWHKIWQTESNRQAAGHLCAYLQEVCYWTARKMAANFTNSHSVADFFQIAILRFDKVLKGFHAALNGSLKNYASLAFSNIIKDELRLRREGEICTNWSLLCKLSQKKLIEALQNQNFKPETIDYYIQAWKCFKTIYGFTEARETRKIPEPDAEKWEAIAKLYNAQRSQLSSSAPVVTPDRLKEWITACGKAARSYLYPKQVSYDAPKQGQEDGELLDLLGSDFEASGLTEIVNQEEEQIRLQHRSQINEVLLKALDKLEKSSQNILQLYYGKGLTQQQIAQQLEIKQYNVSRKLNSHRQTLLLALGEWAKSILHDSVNTDVLNSLNNTLEEWLKVHYNHPEIADNPLNK